MSVHIIYFCVVACYGHKRLCFEADSIAVTQPLCLHSTLALPDETCSTLKSCLTFTCRDMTGIVLCTPIIWSSLMLCDIGVSNYGSGLPCTTKLVHPVVHRALQQVLLFTPVLLLQFNECMCECACVYNFKMASLLYLLIIAFIYEFNLN